MSDDEIESRQPMRQQALRALPSIDALLRTTTAQALRERVGAARLAQLARAVTTELRAEIEANFATERQANGSQANVANNNNDNGRHTKGSDARHTRAALLQKAARELERAVTIETAHALRRVINATGVVLHTNLGRAPLSIKAREALADEAAGYCTLEYDVATGERGRRGARVEELLIELTGAESAIVVNNGAAAALLVLTALAGAGAETIISRGELVEIGGDFRVPDVMAQSGTRMIEVGTTNRTRLNDYERAITERTRLIARIHPSNYRILGFTAAPALYQLATLARSRGLILYEDAGSGALLDLSTYGLEGEPLIRESIAAGVDVISFSGDKLLGATQAGLIIGRRHLIGTLRSHPLYRALRVDKLTLAVLQTTLDAHARDVSFNEIPALQMLALTYDDLRARAHSFLARLRERGIDTSALHCEIIEGLSAVGGGASPTAQLRAALIAITHQTSTPEKLAQALRDATPPIIARISERRVLLDLRTVAPDEEPELLDALAALSPDQTQRTRNASHDKHRSP